MCTFASKTSVSVKGLSAAIITIALTSMYLLDVPLQVKQKPVFAQETNESSLSTTLANDAGANFFTPIILHRCVIC
jgi:hypothetical protein